MKNTFKILSVFVITSFCIGLFWNCSNDKLNENSQKKTGKGLVSGKDIDPLMQLENKLDEMEVIVGYEGNYIVNLAYEEIDFIDIGFYEKIDAIYSLLNFEEEPEGDLTELSDALQSAYEDLLNEIPVITEKGATPEIDIILDSYARSMMKLNRIEDEPNFFALTNYYFTEVNNMDFIDTNVKNYVLDRLRFSFLQIDIFEPLPPLFPLEPLPDFGFFNDICFKDCLKGKLRSFFEYPSYFFDPNSSGSYHLFPDGIMIENTYRIKECILECSDGLRQQILLIMYDEMMEHKLFLSSIAEDINRPDLAGILEKIE